MNSYEKEFIRSIIDFHAIDTERLALCAKNIVHEEEVLGFLNENRIAGVLYFVLDKYNLQLPVSESFYQSVICSYQDQQQQNNDMMQLLKELAMAFHAVNFRYSFLKGAYLIPFVYPLGMRTSNDIDILIDQADIDRIHEVLSFLKYEQKVYRQGRLEVANRREIIYARMNSGELVPYFKEVNLKCITTSCVDVNISLDFQSKRGTSIIPKMLEHCGTYQIDQNTSMRVLDCAEFILHLCAHLYKEATIFNWVAESRDSLLYKYLDIYVLLSKEYEPARWENLKKKVKYYNLYKECYYSIYNSMCLFKSMQANPYIRDFLNSIEPENKDFMNEINWPLYKKKFRNELPIDEWIFVKHKLSYLQEVPSETI